MTGFIDLTGHKYGRLTVLRQGEGKRQPNGDRRTTWLCQCECGNAIEVLSYSLRTGNTASCGCLISDLVVQRCTSHGHAGRKGRTTEYNAWESMKKRCGNEQGYLDVKVCKRWQDSFEAFLEDMGPKPTPQHSIDRIDPTGDYEPSNCRWLPLRAQAANKRNTVWVEWQGQRVSAGVLAKQLGIHRGSLYRVLNRGYSIEEAVAHLKPVVVASSVVFCS